MIILNFVTVHKKALISLCSTPLTIRIVDQEDLIIINSELLVIFMLFIVNLLFMRPSFFMPLKSIYSSFLQIPRQVIYPVLICQLLTKY